MFFVKYANESDPKNHPMNIYAKYLQISQPTIS